jgi:hypothetical protein
MLRKSKFLVTELILEFENKLRWPHDSWEETAYFNLRY